MGNIVDQSHTKKNSYKHIMVSNLTLLNALKMKLTTKVVWLLNSTVLITKWLKLCKRMVKLQDIEIQTIIH